MRYLARGPEPESWTDFKRHNKHKRYGDLQTTAEGRLVRREMREHLVSSQQGLCAYCCARITAEKTSSLIEHIKPRCSFPNETMEYSNLVASCAKNDSCGNAKNDRYDNTFVSPLQSDCAEHFRFYPDGTVEGVNGGEATCELLQLNCYRLREARRALLETLVPWATEEYVREYYLTPDADGHLEQFADMLMQMCDEGYFRTEDESG